MCVSAQPCPALLRLPGLEPSSVCGIFQAKILEWVAIPFSRGSSQPRCQTESPTLAGRFVTTEPPGKPLKSPLGKIYRIQCKCYVNNFLQEASFAFWHFREYFFGIFLICFWLNPWVWNLLICMVNCTLSFQECG